MFTRAREHPQLQEGLIAFIGPGVVFQGTLTFEGVLRVEGHVEGQIMTRGTLILGPGASVQAEIHAGKVISCGRIIGNIQALEGVQFMKPGAFQGIVRTPSLSIEEGVQFNGTCEMAKAAHPAGSLAEPPRLERYEQRSEPGPGNEGEVA